MRLVELTLSEELFLLSLTPEGRSVGESQRMDVAAAGGWLLDLALLERIDVPDKRVDVLDNSEVGHAHLDSALATLTEQHRGRKADRWILQLRKGARKAVARQLHARGYVQRAEKRVLGIFPVERYPLTGRWSPHPTRARLQQVLAGAEADTRTAALATLIYAAKLDRVIVPEVKRRDARRRLRELEREEWVSDAVRRAVQSIESATVGAAAAGGAAGAGGGGGG